MDIESQLTEYARDHVEQSFEFIPKDTPDHRCIDCVWMDNGTEKRIRVQQPTKGDPPKVTYCSDYMDERSSFGLMVLNKRINADSNEEHLDIALNRMFTKIF